MCKHHSSKESLLVFFLFWSLTIYFSFFELSHKFIKSKTSCRHVNNHWNYLFSYGYEKKNVLCKWMNLTSVAAAFAFDNWSIDSRDGHEQYHKQRWAHWLVVVCCWVKIGVCKLTKMGLLFILSIYKTAHWTRTRHSFEVEKMIRLFTLLFSLQTVFLYITNHRNRLITLSDPSFPL